MNRKRSPSVLQAIMLGLAPALATVQNSIEHPLRQLIRWRCGVPRFPNESKQDLFAHLPTNERKQANDTAKHLHSDFHLQYIYSPKSVISRVKIVASYLCSRLTQPTSHILYSLRQAWRPKRLSATKFYSPIPAFSILVVPAVWSLCPYIIIHEKGRETYQLG